MDQWSGYQDMPHEQVNWAALAQQWMAMKEAEPEDSAEKGGHPYAQEGVDHSNWSDEAKKQPVFPSAESVSNERQYASGYHGEWASNDHPPPPPQHMMSHGYSAYPPPPPPNVYNGYDNGGDVMGWNRPPGPPGPPGPHSSHGGGPWYPGPPPFYPPFDPTLMGMPPHAAARGSTPPFFPGNNLDANSRKKLPAWILEGLDKAEKEKQKQLEKQERIRRAEEERAKRRALAGKGKFDSSSEEEEENQADDERSRTRSAASWEDDGDPVFTAKRKEAAVLEDLRTDEEKKMDALQAVKLIMTSLLMDCTDGTLHTLIEQCLIEGERKKAAPKLLSESSALAALSSLGGEDDDSGDEEGEAVQAEVSQSSSPEPDVAAFKAPLLISRNISKPEPTGNKDSTSTPSMSAKPVVEHANGDSASDEEEQSDIHSKKKKRKGDVDESERKRRRSRSRERHRSRSRDRKRSRSRDRKRSRSRDRKRSRSKERKRSRSKERRHRSRSRDKKRSRSRGRRSRSREKRRDSSRDRSRSRERRRR